MSLQSIQLVYRIREYGKIRDEEHGSVLEEITQKEPNNTINIILMIIYTRPARQILKVRRSVRLKTFPKLDMKFDNPPTLLLIGLPLYQTPLSLRS